VTPLRCGSGWAWPGEAGAADWLASLGLRPGDRVACGWLNRPAILPLLAAGLRLGLTLVPLNRRLAVSELRALYARAASRLAIADADHPLAESTTCTAIPPDFAGLPADAAPLRGSLVLFTSGTTGAPKAARLGPACLDAALAAHVAALELRPDDRWSLPLPLDHVGGIMAVLRALRCGCSVDLEAAPGPDATGTSIVPTQLLRLVEAGVAPPTRLRVALTGGGPLSRELKERARTAGWPVRETYGLTEMGSMATLDGVALPGVRLRVVDGRIEVGGAMRFDGYERNGVLEPADTWHATGDLGDLHDGRLRLVGRAAELIVSGGENVAAPEVEAILAQHPAIGEACVVGVPDATWGEAVAAAVVARQPITVAELDAWIGPRLAGFKRPRRWLLVAALPRTALGKVQRHLVHEMLRVRPTGGWKLEAGGAAEETADGPPTANRNTTQPPASSLQPLRIPHDR
jgi:O-succinylbenzoic acid--CoA ligase